MSRPPQIETSLKDFLVSTLPAEAKRAFVEMLEQYQRGREDIVYFSEELLGVPLNAFQKNFLAHSTTPRNLWMERFGTLVEDIGGMLFGRNIAHPSNQVGKTVMIAVKHIWMNFYKIGLDLDGALIMETHYQTLNISPHTRQVRQCFQYAKEILEERFLIDEDGKKRINKLAPLLKNFMVGENVNLGEIRFSNKSIFYSVPTGQDQAASLAGAQFGYISYDECAQSLHLEAELGAKILSRLIKYGVSIDLISTPEVDSPSHQYYLHIVKMGEAGREGWWALGGRLDDNIFISQIQRERVKADLLSTDKKKYRQVVFGEFITGGKRYFEPAEIENLWKLKGKAQCRQGGKYLLVADWGMSDTGDESVFKMFDYSEWIMRGKIRIAAHEKIRGGSPQMQFALLRTLYDLFTWGDEKTGALTFPIFVMDAGALGGVVIKKLLFQLKPRAFDIEKDEALFITKREMSAGRDYFESEIDGAVIEKNPNFGNIESYYIDELGEQLGNYHLDDKKLKQDFVMTFVMGISYISKKIPRHSAKPVSLNPLAGYEASIARPGRPRQDFSRKQLFK